jgi:hypothetical protein
MRLSLSAMIALCVACGPSQGIQPLDAGPWAAADWAMMAPPGGLDLTLTSTVMAGDTIQIDVADANSFTPVFVHMGTAAGAGACYDPGAGPGYCLDILDDVIVASGTTDSGGNASFSLQLPPSFEAGTTRLFQASAQLGALWDTSREMPMQVGATANRIENNLLEGVDWGGATVFGDVNGDAITDVILGTPYAGPGRSTVEVYHGPLGPDFNDMVPDLILELDEESLGQSIALADVTRDRQLELIISNKMDDLVYFVPAGLTGTLDIEAVATATFTVDGLSGGDETFAVGDLDGDTYADLAIGARGDALGNGAVYIAYAPLPEIVTDFAVVADLRLISVDPMQLGYRIASGGDFDGNGTDDLVLSAMGADDMTFVVTDIPPGDRGVVDAAGTVIVGDQDSVAIGDFDGDGLSDLALASYTATQAHVFYAPAGLGQVPKNTADARISFAPIGATAGGLYMVGLPDINGDGRDELAVNDLNDTLGGTTGSGRGAGSIYLFSGLPADSAAPVSSFSRTVGFANNWPTGSRELAVVRDMDGDGLPELMAGAVVMGSIDLTP